MKQLNITFNSLISNLGNTGGCRTIVRSAETLREMGHIVNIVCRKNRYNWTKIKVLNALPAKSDIMVAVSVLDIDSTRKATAKKKVYWKRGHETWLMEERRILEKCSRIKVICNSEWQQAHLKKKGIDSKVCYSGLDYWRHTGSRKPNRIGCLYSDRPSKRWKQFRRLVLALGLDYEYVCFGTKRAKNEFVYGQVTNPNRSALERLYGSCQFWFSPSVLEGQHQVALEAAACGCHVVATGKPKGGTEDFVTNDTGFRYKKIAEAAEYIKTVSKETIDAKNGKMELLLNTKIRTREYCMTKFLEAIYDK